jgi:hypothetical protein
VILVVLGGSRTTKTMKVSAQETKILSFYAFSGMTGVVLILHNLLPLLTGAIGL